MPQGPIPAAIFQKFSNALGFARLDPQGASWHTPRRGTRYGAAYGTPAIASPATPAQAGALYRGSNGVAGQTLSAGLATTYTGLCLSNPIASKLNLSVKLACAFTLAAPGGVLALGLLAGWSAAGITVHTTPLNAGILNGYIGAAAANGSIPGVASSANLDAACTLVGTPLVDRWLASNASSGGLFGFQHETNDGIIVPPGGYVAVVGSVAGPAILGTFEWEELAP